MQRAPIDKWLNHRGSVPAFQICLAFLHCLFSPNHVSVYCFVKLNLKATIQNEFIDKKLDDCYFVKIEYQGECCKNIAFITVDGSREFFRNWKVF